MNANANDTTDDATDAQSEIDSTLVFDPDERYPDDFYTLVAGGIHERGERSVRVEYVLNTEVEDEPQLMTASYYRLNGDRRNEDSGLTWSLTEQDDGTFVVDCNGQELHAFIEDAFNIDPEIEVGAAFDEMVGNSR
jgi:hypothetical protein